MREVGDGCKLRLEYLQGVREWKFQWIEYLGFEMDVCWESMDVDFPQVTTFRLLTMAQFKEFL